MWFILSEQTPWCCSKGYTLELVRKWCLEESVCMATGWRAKGTHLPVGDIYETQIFNVQPVIRVLHGQLAASIQRLINSFHLPPASSFSSQGWSVNTEGTDGFLSYPGGEERTTNSPCKLWTPDFHYKLQIPLRVEWCLPLTVLPRGNCVERKQYCCSWVNS